MAQYSFAERVDLRLFKPDAIRADLRLWNRSITFLVIALVGLVLIAMGSMTVMVPWWLRALDLSVCFAAFLGMFHPLMALTRHRDGLRRELHSSRAFDNNTLEFVAPKSRLSEFHAWGQKKKISFRYAIENANPEDWRCEDNRYFVSFLSEDDLVLFRMTFV